MELILIAAMAKNRVIGHKNRIPWNIPEEMQFFKKSTMGHAVIMGRKTFESIKIPLPRRLNVVLSRDNTYQVSGCRVANSLAAGIKQCSSHKKVFIIGGKTLYTKAMEIVDTILLSVLEKEYIGDTNFPHLPMEHFRLISEIKMEMGEPFTIHTYQRKASRTLS